MDGEVQLSFLVSQSPCLGPPGIVFTVSGLDITSPTSMSASRICAATSMDAWQMLVQTTGSHQGEGVRGAA